MLDKITQYVGSLLPMFKRDRVSEDARVLRGNLEQFAIPAYKQASINFANLKIKSKLVQEKYQDFNRIVKKAQGKNVIDAIAAGLDYISESLDVIDKQIDKRMEDQVASAGTNAAGITIIRSLEVMTFATNYALLFLNWAYWEETKAQGGESRFGEPSAGELKFINDKFPDFCRAMNVYVQNHSIFEKLIESIPDVTIGTDTANGALAVFDSNTVDPLGFSAKLIFTHPRDYENPIYHIGMVVAEYQNSVYQRNKELKMMLEMRALRLQQVLDKEPNAQVEKELEYTQSRVEGLNAKLRKYEKKVS